MDAKELSRELRYGASPDLGRRRGIVGLTMVAAGAMGVIALYQTGIIPHLPEPPLPRLDADKVDASDEAYAKLKTPDAVLGFHSYSTTMALAAAGGMDRAKTHPWIPLALAAKVAADAFQAGKLSIDQWVNHRAFCSYCLAAAVASFATVPLVIPEAREAWRNLRS